MRKSPYLLTACILATLLALLLLILVAAYFSSSAWLGRFASQWLQAYFDTELGISCQQASMNVQRPGWQQLQVEHFKLSDCDHPQLASIHSENILLRYQLSDILQYLTSDTLPSTSASQGPTATPLLQQLSVTDLSIKLQPLSIIAADNAQQANSSNSLPVQQLHTALAGVAGLMQQPLPVTAARIEPVAVELPLLTRHHSSAPSAVLQFQGELQYTRAQGMKAELVASLNRLNDNSPAHLDIHAELLHKGEFQLELRQAEKRLYQLNAALTGITTEAAKHANVDKQAIASDGDGNSTHGLALKAEDKLSLADARQALISWLQPLRPELAASLQRLDIAGSLANSWRWHAAGQLQHRLTISELQLGNTGRLTQIDRLEGQLSADLQWQPRQLQLQLADSSQLRLKLASDYLPHPAVARQWSLQPEQLHMQLRWSEGRLQARSLNGSLHARHATGDDQEDLRLSQLQWHPELLAARFHLQQSRPRLQLLAPSTPSTPAQSAILLEEVTTLAVGTAALNRQLLSFTLEADSTMDIGTLQVDAWTLNDLSLRTGSPLQLHTAVDEVAIELKPLVLQLAATTITNRPPQPDTADFKAQGIKGELSLAPAGPNPAKALQALNGQLRLNLKSVSLPAPIVQQLEHISLQADYRLQLPQLDFDYRLQSGTPALKLNGEGQFNLDQQRLTSHWTLPQQPIAPWFSLLPATAGQTLKPLLIKSGAIQAQGQLSSSPNAGLHGDINLRAGPINARYEKWQLQQFNLQLQAQLDNAAGPPRLAGTLNAELAAAASALRLADFSARSRFDLQWQTDALQQTWTIQQAGFSAFGGTAELEPFTLTSPPPAARAQVQLQGMDLSQLLALQPKANIQGQGTVDGTLPVRLDQDGLHIEQGRVSTRPPGGMLRYHPDNSPLPEGANPGLDMALAVLSNFQYRQLSVDVNFAPDGTLLLDTTLKGRNPDWQRGQPIDFNISIEQNLLKLLQAVQFSDGLSDKINERFQPAN